MAVARAAATPQTNDADEPSDAIERRLRCAGGWEGVIDQMSPWRKRDPFTTDKVKAGRRKAKEAEREWKKIQRFERQLARGRKKNCTAHGQSGKVGVFPVALARQCNVAPGTRASTFSGALLSAVSWPPSHAPVGVGKDAQIAAAGHDKIVVPGLDDRLLRAGAEIDRRRRAGPLDEQDRIAAAFEAGLILGSTSTSKAAIWWS